jgi:hypothetical protein
MMSASLTILALLALLAQAPAPAPPVNPRTETIAALRALAASARWDELDARVQAFGPDDRIWEPLPPVIYSAAIARQDLPGGIATLSPVANPTAAPSIKAAALIVVGRAYRREGNSDAAIRALEQARDAVPATPQAETATGLIYEIKFLSPGLQAPAIDARARNGRPISLARLRGQSAVLVFWGTT